MVIRVGSKQVQAARTREALARSARQFLSANAYETVTLEAVAACAGHSSRSIYRYWPNKADLWRDVMGCEPPLDSAQARQASMVLAGHEDLIRDLTSLLDAIDRGDPKAQLITKVREMLEAQTAPSSGPSPISARAPQADSDATVAPSQLATSIGARLRALRLERDIPQLELAKLLGVSIQQVTRYERALSQIPAASLAKLAGRLGCTVQELVEGAD
jgi:AcrR family transcriptional regulator